MVELCRENLKDYLKGHYPSFDLSGPAVITDLGDSDGEDPSGLINFIFRVTTPSRSLIVKQGREQIRTARDYRLPPGRNRLEYDTLRIRHAVVPQYIPEAYGADPENNVFFMEDVSYLKPARSELTRGVIYPDFARQCAEYIAATAFYTSEFYLDTDAFRSLTTRFSNSAMRRVMEDWVFLRRSPFPDSGENRDLKDRMDADTALTAQCHWMRHKFMTSTETLIHADLHTSNIFVDENRMKVLDMEYTFAGPCCYDVGYLMCNFITQYCSACFRPFACEGERAEFKRYLLRMTYELYTVFLQYFNSYWDRDAKEIYRAAPEFRALLTGRFLPDILGYAAIPVFLQTVSSISFPEFSVITDPAARRSAYELSLIICRHFLLNREGFGTIEQAVASIVEIERIYRAHL